MTHAEASAASEIPLGSKLHAETGVDDNVDMPMKRAAKAGLWPQATANNIGFRRTCEGEHRQPYKDSTSNHENDPGIQFPSLGSY
jgi:hypothetical protein